MQTTATTDPTQRKEPHEPAQRYLWLRAVSAMAGPAYCLAYCFLFCVVLCAENSPAAAQGQPQAKPAATPQPAPPSTPAASKAMTRSSPNIEETRLTVAIYGSPDANPSYRPSNRPPAPGTTMTDAPFRFPNGVDFGIGIILRTSWCDTDLTNMDLRLSIDGRETKVDASSAFQPNPNRADAVIRYTLAPSNQSINEVRMTTTYLTQRWDLKVDETQAARATWPREWPVPTQAFLGKEDGIDPTDPAIRSLAEGSTPQGFRTVAPYIAARNAIVAVLGKWTIVNSSTSELGPNRTLRGVQFSQDGRWGIGIGRGTSVELAATCVAALRSIGIPSRVVYCLTEDDQDERGRSLAKFRYICEFFIPEVGWVPFDPREMRMQGAGTRPITGAIKGFANVSSLNDCVPLAFRLVPEGFTKADRYATWGWAGGARLVDPQFGCSRIMLVESGRGNGKVPTMPAPVGDAGP